jgi:hypothetical protein
MSILLFAQVRAWPANSGAMPLILLEVIRGIALRSKGKSRGLSRAANGVRQKFLASSKGLSF